MQRTLCRIFNATSVKSTIGPLEGIDTSHLTRCKTFTLSVIDHFDVISLTKFNKRNAFHTMPIVAYSATLISHLISLSALADDNVNHLS